MNLEMSLIFLLGTLGTLVEHYLEEHIFSYGEIFGPRKYIPKTPS